MANTNRILRKIRINGVLQDLLAQSNGENVTVIYNGKEQLLSAALAEIFASVSALPTTDAMNAAISAKIDDLIGGAPATYDTLKEIADYIDTHGEAAAALTAQLGNKVDKEAGKGLSANDFTDALKTKLENMAPVTAEEKAAWNDKADKTEATTTKSGLMSAADKVRLDSLRGVRYGTEPPADMQDGELFVQVVGE